VRSYHGATRGKVCVGRAETTDSIMSEISACGSSVRMGPANRFLRRVKIRNYRSVGQCVIDLGRLTVLIGRNGSGKSNFLDALRFVVDGLQTSIDHAIKSRGGMDAVRRRSTGHPRNFSIELEFDLPTDDTATYGFEIGSRTGGGFFVKRERLTIVRPSGQTAARFEMADGQVSASMENMPPASRDRLYLVNAAGLPSFRVVYDALLAMGFYSLNPALMKGFQSPDAGELLHRDGGNIASVIGRLTADEPGTMERIKSYLATIVPGIEDVARKSLGPSETLEFRQHVVGSEFPWKFYAASMSDGTLRALGALVAVMQLANRKEPVRLVGIEEPETALHPAAAGALMDALREAACHTQILITTHSADLVDQLNPEEDQLIAVQSVGGATQLGSLDQPSREAIRDHLYSPGELLRMDQLEIDPDDLKRQEQLSLFDSSEPDASEESS
jgi:predicted ATPase